MRQDAELTAQHQFKLLNEAKSVLNRGDQKPQPTEGLGKGLSHEPSLPAFPPSAGRQAAPGQLNQNVYSQLFFSNVPGSQNAGAGNGAPQFQPLPNQN